MRRVTGTLTNAAGAPLVGLTLRLTAVFNTPETIAAGHRTEFTTDGSGGYDVTLREGRYQVTAMYQHAGTGVILGYANVTDGPDIDLITLLCAEIMEPSLAQQLIDQIALMSARLAETPEIIHGRFHREAEFIFPQADTWTDIPWDAVAYDQHGVTHVGAGVIEVGREISDLAWVEGCIHSRWTGGEGVRAFIAVRVLRRYWDAVLEQYGPWIEARCAQTVSGRPLYPDTPYASRYAGPVSVHERTRLKLQGRVSSTLLRLDGWTGFDDPIAGTIAITSMGLRAYGG